MFHEEKSNPVVHLQDVLWQHEFVFYGHPKSVYRVDVRLTLKWHGSPSKFDAWLNEKSPSNRFGTEIWSDMTSPAFEFDCRLRENKFLLKLAFSTHPVVLQRVEVIIKHRWRSRFLVDVPCVERLCFPQRVGDKLFVGFQDQPKSDGLNLVESNGRTVIFDRFKHVFDSSAYTDSLVPSLQIDLTKKLRAAIQSYRVRGSPLLKLIIHMAYGCGQHFPVFIVGGAVRDAILNQHVKDIDLVVPMSYRHMQLRLREFFVQGRVPLAQGSLLTGKVRRQHGMLRVIAEDQTNDYDLDIGVMTSSIALRAYGFNIGEDSMTRDFTINAIYVDVLTGNVFDPCRGMSCIKAGSLTKLVPTATELNGLWMDTGARFRLWKMLLDQEYTASNEVLDGVSQTLCLDIEYFLKQSDKAGAEQWWRKLAKKLFKDKDPEQIQHRAVALRGCIDKYPRLPWVKCLTGMLGAFASAVLRGEFKCFCNLYDAGQPDAHVWRVIDKLVLRVDWPVMPRTYWRLTGGSWTESEQKPERPAQERGDDDDDDGAHEPVRYCVRFTSLNDVQDEMDLIVEA